MATDRIRLDGPLDVELPDGSLVEIRPGPYKRGISVIPKTEGESTPKRGRGRQPRPGTVKLRERLERDARKGKLRPATDYFSWLIKEDPTVNHQVARQIVYREMGRAQGR